MRHLSPPNGSSTAVNRLSIVILLCCIISFGIVMRSVRSATRAFMAVDNSPDVGDVEDISTALLLTDKVVPVATVVGVVRHRHIIKMIMVVVMVATKVVATIPTGVGS